MTKPHPDYLLFHVKVITTGRSYIRTFLVTIRPPRAEHPYFVHTLLITKLFYLFILFLIKFYCSLITLLFFKIYFLISKVNTSITRQALNAWKFTIVIASFVLIFILQHTTGDMIFRQPHTTVQIRLHLVL